LLFAAKAAANYQQPDQASEILEQFATQHPEHKDFAQLQLAEALLKASKFDQALEILKALKTDQKMTLRLLTEVYCAKSDWSELSALLPVIKRLSVFDENALEALQVKTYRGQLMTIAQTETAEVKRQKIEAVWSDIPRSFRQIPEIIAVYINGLAFADAPEKALNILAKSLKNQWHSCLVEAYGRLEMKDGTKQLALGEQWLLKYPNDPQLRFALGRICRRMGFLGKAKDYLKSTIDLAPSAHAYHELAAVLELLGDTKSSSEVYRQGLRFAIESQTDES
jgi:HemY protein